jgi:ABC-type sugar transport system ATPase subunit
MIELDRVCISAGKFKLSDLSMSLPTGQYTAVMGRTGCGKSTLLETICGLRPTVSGRIIVAGRDVTHWPPSDRNLGYVPQDQALFPTHTVRQHLQFALKLRGWDATAIDQRTKLLAQQLHIEHLLDRLPKGLSGGESQRVALGRALSFQPPVLLMDEPLSALDDDTRSSLIDCLRELKNQRTVTVLHVTHNRFEAQLLADHIVQLS